MGWTANCKIQLLDCMLARIWTAQQRLTWRRRFSSEITYTHGHTRAVVKQHAARTAENSAAHLLPLLESNQRLLDVGCGPGSISIGLAKRVQHVEAVDNMPSVLAQARAAAAQSRGGGGSIRFVQASAHELPYGDAEFDVVHCHQLLQHVGDPVGVLREMRRVCRPGGVVAARESVYSTMRGEGGESEGAEGECLDASSSSSSSSSNSRGCRCRSNRARIDRWREIYMAVCRHNGAEPDAGLFLQRWMLDAGFTPANVCFSSSVVTYSSEDELFRRAWGEAWAERTLHSFGAQALQHGVADSQAELEEVAAGWRAWAADPAAIFLYVNGEVLARR